ncbi:hypothetical protein [Chloroflexus islandicus]|uniref:hypothetical protein n=1 Tax=Chloroflexus islandicus TaxID=1707952 RepID=UPI0012E85A9D|nr:hypothetical protein [Chloroflexus islandicus]
MNASVVELAYSRRGVALSGITTGDIDGGVVPFIAIQLVLVVILVFFPQLALYCRQSRLAARVRHPMPAYKNSGWSVTLHPLALGKLIGLRSGCS